ncbi:MAG: hypothetical protein V7637_185 [Mycobacteriales bacterium]
MSELGDLAADVVVVGAGPVGLLLACELRRAAVRVVVVERLAVPMTESRASQLSTLTAELLRERGFDALLDEAAREPQAHFAGLRVDLSGLPSAYAGNWKVPQYRTEAAFQSRAERLGAELLRCHQLTALSEQQDHVVCLVESPAGARRIRARWVVGCDGAASTVRGLGGFTVARAAPTREMLRADVTGLEIRDRRFERLDRGLAVAVTRDGVSRVMVYEAGSPVVTRPGPPRFAEIARQWYAVTGEDISAGHAIWVDAFDNSRGLATRYRTGRVLLAGDAAHWHMPIGGQALNVGLQDAVNLGWKLAAQVHGWAPPGLLDSYHSERHAVAADVLDSVTAQETLLLGGAEVDPLRAVLAELLQLAPVGDRLARAAAGFDVRYGTDDHPLVGRRLPRTAVQARSGRPAGELAADMAGVLLRPPDPASADRPVPAAPAGQPVPVGPTDRPGAAASADRPVPAAPAANATVTGPAAGCRLRVVHAPPGPAGADPGADSILLRPDGYVAWAGADEEGLDSALARWFGMRLRGPA